MKCVRELWITLYIYVQLHFILGQLTRDTGFGIEFSYFYFVVYVLSLMAQSGRNMWGEY
jgi:hypothetical protein